MAEMNEGTFNKMGGAKPSPAPSSGANEAKAQLDAVMKALGIKSSEWAEGMINSYTVAKNQEGALNQLATRNFAKSLSQARAMKAAEARAAMTVKSALDSPWKSLSAIALKSGTITKGFETAQSVVGAVFPKMAATMAGGMGRMAIAGAGVGVIGLILAKIGDAVMKTMKGGIEVNKAFNASLIESNTGLGRNVSLYAQAALAGTLYGVTQEEITTGLGQLTSSYALNTYTMRGAKMGQQEYLSQVTTSMTKTIGLAKGMGWSAQQTGAVIAQLGLLGGEITDVTGSFGNFVATAKNAGMNVDDFADVVKTLTPVSLYTTDALGRMNEFFVDMGTSLRATTIAAGNAISKQALLSTALKDFGKAAASIDLPSLLAFGGGATAGQPGGLGAAFAKSMEAFKPKVLKDQIKYVLDAIGDQGDAVAGATIWLSQQNAGLSRDSAYTIVQSIDEQRKGMNMDAKEREMKGLTNGDKQLDSLIETSMASAALKDPMGRVADAIEKILGILTSGLARGGMGMMGTLIKNAPVGMRR